MPHIETTRNTTRASYAKMIFDCHLNCGWDANNIRKNQYPTEQTYQDALEKMKIAGVDNAVIVPFPSPGGQFSKKLSWYELENHYLIQASRYSQRLVAFPGVNPADEQSVDMIETLSSAYNIQGVKFSHQTLMRFSIDKLINHRLMTIVQKNNLILMIHIGTGKERGADTIHTTLPFAFKVAKTYPDVSFILCHLGRLHKQLLETLDLPNVWTDTAGLALWSHWNQFIAQEPFPAFKNITPVQIIEELVARGYEDKILFGSDEPYTHYTSQIRHIVHADIPEEAKRKMLYKNMMKLLNKA